MNMKHFSIIILSLIYLVSSIFADSPSIASKTLGAKAQGLGNSFVAVADDYTAVYWNPAGLAFSPFRELQASVEYDNLLMNGMLNTTESSTRQQQINFNELGLLRSIPTSRGGFAFAFGYSSPFLLDKVFSYRGTDTYLGRDSIQSPYFIIVQNDSTKDTIQDYLTYGETMFFDTARTKAYGNINMLNGAVGWQIADGVGVGVTLSLLWGHEKQNIRLRTFTSEGIFEDCSKEIWRSWRGADIRTGILYKPFSWWNIGGMVSIPYWYSLKQIYQYQDMVYDVIFPEERYTATVRSAINLSGGMAFRLPFMLLSIQGDGRAPLVEAAENSNRSRWKGGIAAGIEVPVPAISAVIRGGYQWSQIDLYPFEIKWDDGFYSEEPRVRTDQDQHAVSGGATFYLSKAFIAEAAYTYAVKKYSIIDSDWATPVKEEHAAHKIQVTFSYHY